MDARSKMPTRWTATSDSPRYVARFIRDEDASSTAEDAIIIADDRQHQRVARLMLDRLKLR